MCGDLVPRTQLGRCYGSVLDGSMNDGSVLARSRAARTTLPRSPPVRPCLLMTLVRVHDNGIISPQPPPDLSKRHSLVSQCDNLNAVLSSQSTANHREVWKAGREFSETFFLIQNLRRNKVFNPSLQNGLFVIHNKNQTEKKLSQYDF